MLPSEIILSVIIVFILSKTIMSYRQDKISKLFFLVWSMFWLVSLIVILNTGILKFLAEKLQIGRGVDVAIYVSIIALFYLVYRIFVAINNLDKKITKLVRKQALQDKVEGK